MTVANQYTNPNISYDNSVLISAAGQNSTACQIGGMTLCGIILPDVWTTSTISLQMSIDNGQTWHDVYDNDGTKITLTVSQGTYVKINPADVAGINTLRLVSSGQQAEARTIVIAARPV